MNRYILIFSLTIFLFSTSYASDIDDKLTLVIDVFKLTPKHCQLNFKSNSKIIDAGSVAFKSMALSGNRDISCERCHLDEFGTADGLPMAVGVGGNNDKGNERLTKSGGTLVQRNAFSLKGRSDPVFTSYFWDGKAQRQNKINITQLGELIPEGFNSLLSVAAILPIIERDEFLGRQSLLTSNLIEEKVGDVVYYQKFKMVSQALFERLRSPKENVDKVLALSLKKSGVTISPMVLVDIGNRLAAFIDSKFQCKVSAWDKYMSGDRNALTDNQKQGAFLFYGKGRCGSCHIGSYHSDFKFHSIGTPQGSFGPHSRHRDIGRAAVTHVNNDLYRFRTPPLNGVITTAPYGHSGVFKDLESVVVHHLNPLEFYLQNDLYRETDKYMIGKLIGSRNPVLATIDLKNEIEIKKIVDFLGAL